MKRFLLLILLVSVVSADIIIDAEHEQFNITISENGDVNYVHEIDYVSSAPIGSLSLSLYPMQGAVQLEYWGDKGTFDTEEWDGELLTLHVVFDQPTSEYTFTMQYVVSGLSETHGRLVKARYCANPYYSADSVVSLPSGATYISSQPRIIFSGSPLRAPTNISRDYQCQSIAFLRQSGVGYKIDDRGGYFIVHSQTAPDFEPEITRGAGFDNRIAAEIGMPRPYGTFVYLLLDSNTTDIWEWASGEYNTPGIILMRAQNESGRRNIPLTLVHEQTHSYNSQIVRIPSQSFWFDEGVADYMSHLAAIEFQTSEWDIFTDDPYYSRPGANFAALREYYLSNEDWMEEWDPLNDAYSDQITFGYAYSEFIIRAYVYEYGSDALRRAYQCLVPYGSQLRAREEANNIVLACMVSSAPGSDPVQIMYPGKELMYDESRLLNYVRTIGASARTTSTPTPTPFFVPSPVFSPSPGVSPAVSPAISPSITPVPSPTETPAASPTPSVWPSPYPSYSPTPEPGPPPCCCSEMLVLLCFVPAAMFVKVI